VFDAHQVVEVRVERENQESFVWNIFRQSSLNEIIKRASDQSDGED
jgi:hypothetical protein